MTIFNFFEFLGNHIYNISYLFGIFFSIKGALIIKEECECGNDYKNKILLKAIKSYLIAAFFIGTPSIIDFWINF